MHKPLANEERIETHFIAKEHNQAIAFTENQSSGVLAVAPVLSIEALWEFSLIEQSAIHSRLKQAGVRSIWNSRFAKNCG